WRCRRVTAQGELARQDKQRRAIELLVAGVSVTEVPGAVGVHRTTVWRWFADESFEEELARRREQVWGLVADQGRATLLAALGTIMKAVAAGDLEAAQAFVRTLQPALLAVVAPTPDAGSRAEPGEWLQRELVDLIGRRERDDD